MLSSKFLLLLGLSLIFVSCGSTSVTATKTLSVKAVSMTHDLTKNNGDVKVVERIRGKQCIIDGQTIATNDSMYLYDELIVNSQKKYNADLLTDAVFYDEIGCLVVEADAAKFVAAKQK